MFNVHFHTNCSITKPQRFPLCRADILSSFKLNIKWYAFLYANRSFLCCFVSIGGAKTKTFFMSKFHNKNVRNDTKRRDNKKIKTIQEKRRNFWQGFPIGWMINMVAMCVWNDSIYGSRKNACCQIGRSLNWLKCLIRQMRSKCSVWMNEWMNERWCSSINIDYICSLYVRYTV